MRTNSATKPPPRPPLQEQPNGVEASTPQLAPYTSRWYQVPRLHIWKQNCGAHPCTVTLPARCTRYWLGDHSSHLVSSLSSLPCSCLGLTRSGTAAILPFRSYTAWDSSTVPILLQEREIGRSPLGHPFGSYIRPLPCAFLHRPRDTSKDPTLASPPHQPQTTANN